ncbi:MAG: hypothetical protein J1E40_13300 [Oscillospiraceae bacterium]|nr:hypothetical protein [Oscillospiraceae bacterium]
MKRSVKAIAAAAAALTMALSCVSAAYAVSDAPAVQSDNESVTKYEFTERKTVEVPYNGNVMFADNDGTVYYMGSVSKDRAKIFTLDENGKIRYSYNCDSYVNDKGEKISPLMNPTLKQCGDYLYLIYSEYSGLVYMSVKENVIVKLDKKLNEIEKYRYEKGNSIDTNGEKVVYLKGYSKIYICDMDGKNKKLLYSVKNNAKPHEQPLNSIAIAGNYVGFQKRTGYANESDRKEYCGIIDIQTGGITLHEQRSVKQVFSSNGNLIWYGDYGYYPENDDSNISSDVISGGAAAVDSYLSKRYKYYSNSEIYVFDCESYSVVKTPNAKEAGQDSIIDNKGNLITTSYDGKGNVIYRIYRDGRLLGEHTVSYKGYCKAVANDGVLTICYDGYTPTADDWIGWNDSTPQEEVEAMLAEQAERSAKLKEMYPMKSVTFSYK